MKCMIHCFERRILNSFDDLKKKNSEDSLTIIEAEDLKYCSLAMFTV